ncbi:large proline-rich protein bag6-B isoform X1 [Euwallacea fornicatus]|uniref:large proline-rich protein bag6-B isoform X1 n=1 Tax=Euwallacea fornicatus TaxID=995702 RepID=UPI0033903B10
MITITVKTLDSQNHQFSVDENITVQQFKNHIAETVSIPVARQRIIYCGRVLQDNLKLSDYDVDGKVVHLVQRAPPGASSRNVRSLTPPPDLNRARSGFRGFDRSGNTVYMGMGSMTFPQNLIDPPPVIPPRATHTLSSSRLNVARRMLKNAENVIRLLENPNMGADPPPQAEETAEEEMTPVIEARVIVPTNGDQPIDGNAIINAVQNTIFPTMGNMELGPSTSTSNVESTTGPQLSASAPETPRSTSSENLNADSAEAPRDGSPAAPRLRCRGTEMATLLTTLNQLQVRFAPFLARYQTFMQDDPQVAQEDLSEIHLMLNRVSKVLHYLGHAYHSLSDIIIHAEHPPPRLLLCRPILIQPPALVQTSIPVQVEAQINLSAERPMPNNGSAPGSTVNAAGTATPSAAGAPPSADTAGTDVPNSLPNSVLGGQPQVGSTSINIQPGFMGLPFMPGGSMRVFTAPVEIRTLRASTPRTRSTNNNNNIRNTSAPASAAESASNAPTPNEGAPNPNPPTGQTGQAPSGGPFNTGGGNLEFFMEVTPETLRGGNLIQSLMQLVGSQLGDTIAQAQNQRSDGTQGGNTQQSQARSTQTNPATVTHTQSTPRPHVHMTQQAVQGGFDPFLHCYSHHVSQSRPQRIVSLGPHPNRQESTAGRESGSTIAEPTTQNPGGQPIPTMGGNLPPNLVVQIENMFRHLPSPMVDFPRLGALLEDRQHRGQNASAPGETQSAPSNQSQGTLTRGAPDGQTQNSSQPRPTQDILGFISALMDQSLPDLLGSGPTLDVYVQSFSPEPYIQGESLIIDLIMLMLRNLRINDLFAISSGNMAPLERQITTIQEFFLNEVCRNDTTDAGITRATERILTDFAPIISALESVPARENIDMVRTIEGFFRQRVPGIIRLAINTGARTEGNSVQDVSNLLSIQDASNLLSTIWLTVRELLALAVHCSANGQQGVESACEDIMVSTLFNQSDVPNDIHRWTISSSRTAIRTILRDLNVTPSDIEQYVVRKAAESATMSESVPELNRANESVESMDVDFVPSPTNVEPVLIAAPIEDTEPIPNVIWGSESWHNQTPEEWVPIITRDVQRQRRQNSQPSFSDSYLSGVPSKRRKVINNAKPQGSLPQVISETVRQVVTSAGLSSVAPLDAVAQAASESLDIQSAYRSLLQTTVQANLRNNEDYTPESFPNTAHYFESPPE